MDIIKVKIPVVGKGHLVNKKFLTNPWEEKGVGCANGCIKIVLDDNMMDQIRSFKAMIHDRSFEHSRKYGVNEENTTRLDEIPTDIIPGRTDPYLIVEEPGVFFWVGGVDQPDWTPETNDEGQYRETKIDGTIVYRLKKHLGKTVPPDSNSELNAYVVSNSTVDEGKPLYPAVPSPKSSMSTFTFTPRSITGGKSKSRRTRRLKKKRKKKQTKKRKKKRRTKKRYKRRKKKSVRKRGKKKN